MTFLSGAKPRAGLLPPGSIRNYSSKSEDKLARDPY